MHKKTRVVKEGTRWCVERLNCGAWERYPMRFGTRSRARAHQAFWAQA